LIFCSNPVGAIIASLILGKVLDEVKYIINAIFERKIGLSLWWRHSFYKVLAYFYSVSQTGWMELLRLQLLQLEQG
jgi:hypothetical protein